MRVRFDGGDRTAEKEQIAGVFPAQISTWLGLIEYMAFITNHRIILSKLKSSLLLEVLGPGASIIGLHVKRKEVESEFRRTPDDVETRLDEILNRDKKNIQIRYDRVQRIEYKHGKKWSAPILRVSYMGPLFKSKNQIDLIILPGESYAKAKRAEGVKAGETFVTLSNELFEYMRYFLRHKIVVKS